MFHPLRLVSLYGVRSSLPQARWAALAILLFLIPVTLIFHPYWTFEGQEARHQFHSFFKNLAIMGGMAYILAYGSGPLSLGKDPCEKRDE